jgi:tetratricopeptide (TPR) repeat protein
VNSFDFDKKLLQARHFVQLKNLPGALKMYAQLTREYPQSNLWDEYGRAAASAGEYDLAEKIWEKLRGVEPNTAGLLSRLAEEHGKIWLFSKARALAFEAAKLEPGNLSVQLSLASFLARTNSVEEARAAVNKCLELDPRNEPALYLSAHLLRREDKLADAERQFRGMLASGLRDPQVRYFCHLELARILDRTECFDEAMAELAEAKRIAAQTIDLAGAVKTFDERRERVVRKTRALPKNILEVWNKAFPPEARTAAAPLAFLGGHARSGTTLLERILDAHPCVAACDEALAFQTISQLVDITAPEIPTAGLNFLRQRYLQNLTKVLESPPEGKILVDKNPPATAYLPAFLRVFPELRVLIALRDPRDVMVSCYFQTLVQASHLSLERLAQHYSCIMDVWLIVREWEGLAWIETRYEDIVADLRKERSWNKWDASLIPSALTPKRPTR